ncbi:hypothetical protein [Streptomyces canus]
MAAADRASPTAVSGLELMTALRPPTKAVQDPEINAATAQLGP